MKLSLIIFCLSLMVGCSTIHPKSTPSLSLSSYGVYIDNRRPVSIKKDASSTSGVKTANSPLLVCESSQVPLTLGRTFGIRYKIRAPRDSHIKRVAVETHHPEIIGYDSKPSTVHHWQSEVSHYEDGSFVGGAQFLFEEPYELQPGVWKIIVKYEDSVIEKQFKVSPDYELNSENCSSV